MAFLNERFSLVENFLIFGRQLSMWIILLISPTPGGSGIAEFIFSQFLTDFIPNEFMVCTAGTFLEADFVLSIPDNWCYRITNLDKKGFQKRKKI